MHVSTYPRLLVLTLCLALLPVHGIAESWRSDRRRADLPDLPYPPNYNAATCSRDTSNAFGLTFTPDTTPPSNVLSKTKSTRTVVVPRARTGVLADVCRQLTSLYFPAVAFRYFKIGVPHLLPGNVYVLSIRTPASKRIDEISAHVVGAGPAPDRFLGRSRPMTNVGTLQIMVQARVEVNINVVFQEGNTPGEMAFFALGAAQDPSAAWPNRFGPGPVGVAKT